MFTHTHASKRATVASRCRWLCPRLCPRLCYKFICCAFTIDTQNYWILPMVIHLFQMHMYLCACVSVPACVFVTSRACAFCGSIVKVNERWRRCRQRFPCRFKCKSIRNRISIDSIDLHYLSPALLLSSLFTVVVHSILRALSLSWQQSANVCVSKKIETERATPRLRRLRQRQRQRWRPMTTPSRSWADVIANLFGLCCCCCCCCCLLQNCSSYILKL